MSTLAEIAEEVAQTHGLDATMAMPPRKIMALAHFIGKRRKRALIDTAIAGRLAQSDKSSWQEFIKESN
jgi:hypothetical protein